MSYSRSDRSSDGRSRHCQLRDVFVSRRPSGRTRRRRRGKSVRPGNGSAVIGSYWSNRHVPCADARVLTKFHTKTINEMDCDYTVSSVTDLPRPLNLSYASVIKIKKIHDGYRVGMG